MEGPSLGLERIEVMPSDWFLEGWGFLLFEDNDVILIFSSRKQVTSRFNLYI